ncbi:MAG TPA: PilZ domain-containing protein, partial [Polyangia bacterium]|nr:PilZ domain-containing protein [Polyangia bacterium]
MIRPNDRRDSYRLHLDPGQAVVRVKDGPPVELRDLSASGGRLIVREAGSERPELPLLEIELASGGSLAAQPHVVRVRSHEPGVFHLGARFRNLDPEGVHKLSRFIAREFERRSSDPSRLLDLSRSLAVRSPLFIRNIFAACDPLARLAVIDRSLRLGAELRVSGVAFSEGRRVIRACFAGAQPALSTERPYSFLLGGSGAVTVFESRCLEQRGPEVLLALPEEVRQAGSRDARRIELPGPAPLRVSFGHPRLAGVTSGGPILDVAERGL